MLNLSIGNVFNALSSYGLHLKIQLCLSFLISCYMVCAPGQPNPKLIHRINSSRIVLLRTRIKRKL